MLCLLKEALHFVLVVPLQALATGPGALFIEGGSAGANNATDLAVKVREDPLFHIRKKEEEAKKKLASNPIKLKQLQQVCAH